MEVISIYLTCSWLNIIKVSETSIRGFLNINQYVLTYQLSTQFTRRNKIKEKDNKDENKIWETSILEYFDLTSWFRLNAPLRDSFSTFFVLHSKTCILHLNPFQPLKRNNINQFTHVPFAFIPKLHAYLNLCCTKFKFGMNSIINYN